MTKLNYCEHNGYLISADEEMLTDPSIYAAPELPQIDGCNHLICSACSQPVRSCCAHFFPDKTKGKAKEIYDTPDWHQLSYLVYKETQTSDVRLYCCQCAIARTRLPKAIDDLEEKGIPYSWRCGGHPPVSLPYRFLGIEITGQTDWCELVTRAFIGWRPPEFTEDPTDEDPPGYWLQSLYARLHQLSEGNQLAEAIAGALSHPDPRVRSLALRFFGNFPHASGALWLRELMGDDRALYRHIPDPYSLTVEHPQLEDTLLWALSKQVEEGSDNREALTILKIEALIEGRALPTLSQLGEYEPKWLAGHALEIAQASPCCVPKFIHILYLQGANLAETVPPLLNIPGVDLDAVQALVKQHVHGDTQQIVLAALCERNKEVL